MIYVFGTMIVMLIAALVAMWARRHLTASADEQLIALRAAVDELKASARKASASADRIEKKHKGEP